MIIRRAIANLDEEFRKRTLLCADNTLFSGRSVSLLTVTCEFYQLPPDLGGT